MLISEIYVSRQGEGLLTGTPSVFLRTSGCNLRCWFCDTPFASWNPEGSQIEVDSIIEDVTSRARQENAQHVVITGGEPMLQKQITALTSGLKEKGLHITIETAGTVWHKVDCDLMSISPKLSNSTPSVERAGEWVQRHEKTRDSISIVRRLVENFDHQLKFVVDTEDDFAEIEAYLIELGKELSQPLESQRVLLMPQGTKQSELVARELWLKPYCEKQGYTLSARKHIQWYGNKRGT